MGIGRPVTWGYFWRIGHPVKWESATLFRELVTRFWWYSMESVAQSHRRYLSGIGHPIYRESVALVGNWTPSSCNIQWENICPVTFIPVMRIYHGGIYHACLVLPNRWVSPSWSHQVRCDSFVVIFNGKRSPSHIRIFLGNPSPVKWESVTLFRELVTCF